MLWWFVVIASICIIALVIEVIVSMLLYVCYCLLVAVYIACCLLSSSCGCCVLHMSVMSLSYWKKWCWCSLSVVTYEDMLSMDCCLGRLLLWLLWLGMCVWVCFSFPVDAPQCGCSLLFSLSSKPSLEMLEQSHDEQETKQAQCPSRMKQNPHHIDQILALAYVYTYIYMYTHTTMSSDIQCHESPSVVSCVEFLSAPCVQRVAWRKAHVGLVSTASGGWQIQIFFLQTAPSQHLQHPREQSLKVFSCGKVHKQWDLRSHAS